MIVRRMYIAIVLFMVVILWLISNSFTVVLEAVGLILVAYVVYSLLFKNEDALPVGHIALLMSGLQWIVSPIVAYHSSPVLFSMAVPEEEYLIKTMILYVPFYASVLYFIPSMNTYMTKDYLIRFCHSQKSGIVKLTIIGFVASFIPTLPATMNFILVLVENLLYIGAIMLCFAYPRRAVTIGSLFMAYLLLRSISNGMFHDLMIWSLFMLLVIFVIKEYHPYKRLSILICLFLMVSSLQAIKPIYRHYTWYGNYQENKVELFLNLFMQSLTGELQTEEAGDLNGRLNQGWIISRIYKRIPTEHPYVGGRTILEGVEATLVPRFLSPNKKGAGKESIDDFEAFTGYRPSSGTSMGLSILGETYGNFGLLFGIICMAFWGWLIAKIISRIHRVSTTTGYWYFFLPLICFDLIKAEINFISVVNWTFKAFLFTWIIIYIIRCYPNKKYVVNIRPEEEDRS